MKPLGVILFVILFHFSYSQTTREDTLALTRDLIKEKKFEEANNLLASYNSLNNDVNALRQQAQLLYWMKRPKEARETYERTYSLFPDDPSLRREYAQFLFDHNKLISARSLLETSIKTDSLNVESIQMLAYIDLWTGQLSQAKQKANWLQQHPGGAAAAENIMQTISEYTTPHLTVSGGSYSDDQPMKRYSFELSGGVYRSWLFAPYFAASLLQFDINDAKLRTRWLRAGNKIYIAQTKTNIDISLGTFYARDHNIGTTYKAKLEQTIASGISVDGAIEERPYQYTLSSIQQPFLYKLSEFGINYTRKDRWLGRVAYQGQGFVEGNRVSTTYAWLLAPVIHRAKLSLKAGYGFSTADSKKNKFQPKTTDFSTYTTGSKIEGIYDPYFTPFDQTVHSILAAIKYTPAKNVIFSTNISVGVIASTYLPYHYIEGNNNGQIFIGKQYLPHDYTPIDITGAIHYKASQRLMLNLSYQYNSLIFFKSHFVNMQIKYLFQNAKVKR